MTRNRPHAFTIIEMLVVIGIITLLIVILLPALGAAKRSGQNRVCLSNLHAIGEAMDLYLKDHDDVFPPGPNDPANPNRYDLFGQAGSVLATPAADRILNRDRYLGTGSEVAHCPLDTGVFTVPAAVSAYDAFGSSYIYPDGAYPTQAYGVVAVEGARKTQLKYPAFKMLIADVIVDSQTFGDKPVHRWHGDKEPFRVNMLFMDGRVSNPSRKTAADGDTMTGAATPLDLLNSPKGYY